jgi:peptidoglycan/xylan/chitin deacetylase (PgdA/CDA1 family)
MTFPVVIAVLTAGATRWLVRWPFVPAAVLAGGITSWLLAQASYPAVALAIAPAAGVAAGLCWPRTEGVRSSLALVAPVVAVGAVLVIMRFVVGRDASMAFAAIAATIAATVAAIASARASLSGWPSFRRATVASVGVLLLCGVTAAYAGATTPGVTWFGGLVHHGPRDGRKVAITFDDGPDPPYTLRIRDILDRYGVKATFFEVGKAVDARPDVSKALLDDGQLLGNHSYHHDAVRWLNPRYTELQSAQDAFARNLGVCPAFFRPPHGSHTPFMARVVEDHGMTMVTWDDSAGDWATDNGDLVARRILDKVKPGSIILLHDGIDGNIGADRSVILRALPLIIEGLRERGLEPVRLDELLGRPGYLPSC